ncbi:MAG TPA: hypothetical protein VIH04_07925 [Nitrosarchaeum sp.]
MTATGSDNFTSTSLGTGVAETELGTGINTPSQARSITSIVPYYGATGAYTAAQGAVAEIALRSDSVSLTPKRVIVSAGNGGVGAFIDVIVPILEEWKFNTPLTGQSLLHCYGTSQTANTVAFEAGCEVIYSTDSPREPEKFWMKPNDETATSTTTGIKTVGGTMQITAGSSSCTITDLWALPYVAGTVTVSESLYGIFEFQSNDFNDAMPLRMAVQPMGAGLNTVCLHMLKMARRSVWKPTKPTTLIQTYFTLDEAQTAAQAFIGGVGYIKQ